MISLNNVKLRGKLTLIVAVLLIPVAILAYLFIDTNLKDIHFAEKERQGTAYIAGLWDVTSSLALANATDSSPSHYSSGSVDLDGMSAKFDAVLGTQAPTSAFRAGLQSLGYPNAPLIDDAGPAAVIAKARTAIGAVGDASNLTLDPDLDSFYVMDAMVVRNPEIADRVQQVTTLIHEQSKKTSLSDDDKGAMMVALAALDTVATTSDASLASAYAGNKSGDTRKALSQLQASSDSALKAFTSTAQTAAAALRNRGTVDYSDVRSKAEAALTANSSLTTAGLKELDRLLQVRIAGFWASLWLMLGIAGTVTGLALALTAYIAFEISGTLGKMIGVMTRLASDDFDVTINGAQRRDEIGAMAKSVEIFKTNGLESQRAFRENLRIKVALDNSTNSVAVADTGGVIIYANTSFMVLLKTLENDMRSINASFDSSRILSQPFDVLLASAPHERGMLDRLSGSYATTINIGSKIVTLAADPVVDQNGNRLGSVVEFKDVTAERMIEAEVDKVVSEAVAGNFNERLSIDGKTGFMKNLAEAMNRLCENTATSLTEVSTHLGYLADGDLTKRIEHSYSGLFEDLKNKLNDTCDQLGTIVEEVVAGAGEIKVATAEISAGTNDLSQRTEQQASSLEETASSMEQIASTIRQNADNAQEASRLAGTASSVATTGGEVVAQAVDAMSRIEGSSQKITDIIGVIDEIAFQTNLLALNAAVEAARAGDAGKGFAVVAAEVRSLAQRSSGAAKDIKTLIAASGAEVKDGVKLVNDAGASLKEIVGSIKKVAEIVSEIAAASKEQSVGVEEINTAVSQMDEMTQQNSALVEENAASSRMLQDQAESMHQRMAFFTLQTNNLETTKTIRPVGIVARVEKPQTRPHKSQVRRAAGGRGGAAVLQEDLRSAIENDADWAEF